MESFKEFNDFINNYDCPICKEKINNWKIITPCNHVFHKKCYHNSMSTCPICRKSTFNLDNSVYYKKQLFELKRNYFENLQLHRNKIETELELKQKHIQFYFIRTLFCIFLSFVIIKVIC